MTLPRGAPPPSSNPKHAPAGRKGYPMTSPATHTQKACAECTALVPHTHEHESDGTWRCPSGSTPGRLYIVYRVKVGEGLVWQCNCAHGSNWPWGQEPHCDHVAVVKVMAARKRLRAMQRMASVRRPRRVTSGRVGRRYPLLFD